MEYEASLCSGCGQPRHESFDPTSTYVAEPLQCRACAERDAEQRRASKARAEGRFSESAFDGLYIAVAERE